MTKDEALKLALDVLENHTAIKHPQQRGYRDEAIEAIKEALGTCNPHPDAPHGFDRNSSHTEDRYVCECESWTPPQQIVTSDNSNSHQQEPVAYAAMINGEIAWDADYPFSNEPFSCFDDEQAVPLYTSPPVSKPWVGLTDEQILSLVPGLQDCLCDPLDYNNSGDCYASIPKDMIRLARAIEAAHGIKGDA